MMNKSKIQLKAKNIDVSKFKFDEPSKNRNNGQMVYFDYNGDMPIIQTPWMKAPFGVYDIIDENNKRFVKLTTTFDNHENEDEVNLFMSKMKDLDEHLIDLATKCSKKWFGANKKKEIVEDNYRRLVQEGSEKRKDPKDKDSDPLTDEEGNVLRWEPSFAAVKFYVDDRSNPSKIKVKCTDKNKNPYDFSSIPKQSKVRMLLTASSIWFIGKNRFGITFVCNEIQVDADEKQQQMSFDDSDSDDDHDEEEEIEEED